MSGDDGAPAVVWVRVIRRAHLHPHVKLVALILATHADPDGTNAYPGIARLTVQSSVSYSTVQRAMHQLRQLGAIEAMPRAGMKRHWRTRYRLTAGELLAGIVPTPAAEDADIELVAEAERRRLRAYRGQHRKTRHLSDVSSSADPADETSPADVSSDDETSLIDVDETSGPLASPAATVPVPIPVPTPKPQPCLTELDVAAPGTGTRAHANGHDSTGFDVRTQAGTDAERRRQDAELDEWIRQHPGSGDETS